MYVKTGIQRDTKYSGRFHAAKSKQADMKSCLTNKYHILGRSGSNEVASLCLFWETDAIKSLKISGQVQSGLETIPHTSLIEQKSEISATHIHGLH